MGRLLGAKGDLDELLRPSGTGGAPGAIELAKRLGPSLSGSRIEFLGQIEGHHGVRRRDSSRKERPDLLWNEPKTHVPLDSSRLQSVSGDERGQIAPLQIAIGLAPGNEIEAMVAGGADSGSQKRRVLKQMGYLARMRPERKDLGATRKAWGELGESLPGQRPLEPGPNAGVDPLNLLMRGEQKQRPGVLRRETPPLVGAVAPSSLDRGTLHEPSIAEFGRRQLPVNGHDPHPGRAQVQAPCRFRYRDWVYH